MNVNQSQTGHASTSAGRMDLLFVTVIGFLFFLETARELIGATYSMNLATLSLNSSVVAIFTFFSPFVYLFGLSRINPCLLIVTSGIVLAVSRAAMSVDLPVELYLIFAVIAVAAFGIFLPALIVVLKQYSHSASAMVVAATLGAGADLMFRALGDTFDISVYGISSHRLTAVVVVLPLVICFVARLLRWYSTTTTVYNMPRNPPSVRAFFGFSLGAVGFLYFALLGYPNNVARWVEGSYVLAAVLSGAALGGFVLVSLTSAKKWLTSSTGVVSGITLLAALIVCMIPVPVLAVVLCGIALFFLPVQFYNAVSYLVQPGTTVKQVGAFLGTASVSLVVFILLSAFSLNYAYVPGMNILRGQISTIMMAATVLTLVFVIWYRGNPTKDTTKINNSKSKMLTAALGVIIIAGTWFGPAVYQSHAAPENEGLVVITYNIQQGFNTRGKINPWEILEPLNRISPHILGLQESDTDRISSTNVDIVQWLAHKLNMYTYFGPETRQQTYGVAILSKFPLYNTETYYLTSVGEQTVLIRADIWWRGKPLSVYITHLGETEEDRTTQVSEILQILSENANRKILIGDFNSLPDSEQMRALTQVLDDAWTKAGNLHMDPLGNTSSALEPVKRIDYILTSGDLTVKTCEVIRNVYGSDHLPVWAEIA